MNKKLVHEIATQLGIASKDIVSTLARFEYTSAWAGVVCLLTAGVCMGVLVYAVNKLVPSSADKLLFATVGGILLFLLFLLVHSLIIRLVDPTGAAVYHLTGQFTS